MNDHVEPDLNLNKRESNVFIECQVKCDFGEGKEVNACWDDEKKAFICANLFTGEANMCVDTNFLQKNPKLYVYQPGATKGYETIVQQRNPVGSNTEHFAIENQIIVNEIRSPTAEIKKLSLTDRFLSVWILLAMIIGVILGYYTNISKKLDTVQISTVSLPIAIGLWLMMWPVLTKVRYELIGDAFREKGIRKQILISLTLNWIVGPLLMTGLAWATLPDLPSYRNGLILVGIARCIAMVLIWNQLAGGDPEYCAILVAINSILQMILYSPLAIFYLRIVSNEQGLQIEFWDVCKSVLIFLGAPLAAGVVVRYTVIFVKGRSWLDKTFLPIVGPIALIALIYTVLILFALQGERVINQITDVCRVSVPMILYFCSMWSFTFWVTRKFKSNYEKTVPQAFTAASNNFELAIAIAVASFGVNSEEALAATVGPLIEVPALLILVYVSLWLRKRLRWIE